VSLNYLATKFQCTWPWSTLVMLCDGRIVCGCADPYGKRVLGDARTASLGEIWRDTRISTLRAELNAGGSKFCGDCPLKLPLGGQAPTERSLDVGRLPSRLYIECTAACNISCSEACCAPETGITKTRSAGMLDFELFRNVVDEAGPGLVRIDFFNYGEAFLHKRAIEMCEYIKGRFPHIYLYTSTNGLMFTEESARRLTHSGIDEVTFSIDGASQDTYVQYRQRGKFDLAIRNLRVMAEEKRKSRRDVPHLNWRYILFKWNDTDEEMNRARTLAADIGVDRLSWELTDHPESAFSRRFLPGTPDFESIRHEIWDMTGLGNAIPGATPKAKIEVRKRFFPTRPFTTRADRKLKIKTRVQNVCDRPFPAKASYGRRLVRLGAQLCDENGTLLERDYARAWLPETLKPGAIVDVPIEIVAPKKPGNYMLKFDLVSEGIDWFENNGSPTTLKPLVVK
jgi:MoaA/NifB/PqqE/SkfB family radical SAM enzyme